MIAMKTKTFFFMIIITVVLLALSACSPDVTEDLLDTSVLPNGTHTVQSYRVSAGATVDFSVKCYLIKISFQFFLNEHRLVEKISIR